MIITAIEPQQKAKDRVNLFVDGQFSLGLHLDVLIDFRLKIKDEINQAKLDELRTADAFRTTYDKAVSYLTSRPHSAREVRQYLTDRLIYKHREWGGLTGDARDQFMAQQQTAITAIMQRLEDRQYLNDAAFAKWWIDNRRTFRPRGKRLLLLELQAKGVSAADIQTALTTPDEQGTFVSEISSQIESEEDISEVGLAWRLAEKQQRKYAGLEPNDFKQKMSRFLLSKGFDWDVVDEVLKKLAKPSG